MSSGTPFVSVILAVKNGERYLAEAIESVLGSDHKNFELLIVDGHSTDETREIAGRYKQARLVLQEGSGIASAWNQGINLSSGDLIAFMSADDIWAPTKLTAQVSVLARDQSVQFVVGLAKFFLQEGCSIPKGFKPDLLGDARPAFIMETLLARKSVFREVGMFDPALKISEDVDWFARARDMRIKDAVLPEVVVRKRVHDHNISLTPDPSYLLQALHRSAARKRGLQKI